MSAGSKHWITTRFCFSGSCPMIVPIDTTCVLHRFGMCIGLECATSGSINCSILVYLLLLEREDI